MHDETTRTARKAMKSRRRPTQARSREMVARILDGTRKLLHEQGSAKLTTIAIARVAGMSVGSLYQYFPNKEAILLHLVQDWLADVQDAMSLLASDAPIEKWTDVESTLHRFHEKLRGIYLDRADLLPVVDAMGDSAALAEIYREHNERIAQSLAAWLSTIDAALPPATARNLGHLMLQVGHTSLAASLGHDDGLADIVSDVDAMLMALICRHLSLG